MTSGARDMDAALEGRYTIERELGRGGMATVYLAQDLKLDRRVALKVIRPELAASVGNERFLREIEIAARLSHPHILPLHDSGEAGGHLYYAMPYVEGESLRQRLEREGQLPIAEVIAIVRAVASALTYAHQEGIIHRDIKPENILLAKDASGGAAHPLVADFGIARALDVAGGERLTETGLALGTPAYMSPEQSAADHRLDGRSDIYALGCVAYEMLAGAPPFTGPTAQSILARHAVDPVPSLHTVRGTVPPSIEYAIERALAKVPADRFATADEFARALTSERAPLRHVGQSRRRVQVLLGLAGGLALVGGALMLLRGSSPAVVRSAARIAVLPFFGGADTALNRLGRDLAVTLSASLDRVGGVETADRLMVASATADGSGLSAVDGATLARRVGASSFLRGTLVRAGDNVRLDLGLYSSDGLAPLAEGITVSAHRDSIGTLTDSAAWALLRQVWQRGEPPSPSLAAITTRSLPALRAFLEGEREVAANRWDEAALAYSSAIAADSSFWLAHFRYALAQYWMERPVEPEVLEAVRLHQEVLPERERLLVDGFLTTDSLSLRIKRYQEVTQRFPDYWPGWFLYGDVLAHFGPFLGHDWSDGLQAFRRAVALNPKLVPAWQHIFILTNGRDHAEASRALARLTELGWPALDRPRLAYRLWNEISRAGGELTPGLIGLADSLAERTVSATSRQARLEIIPLALLQQGFPAAQLDFNRRALRLANTDPELVTALQAANAWAWAACGQWDSALATMSEAARASLGPIAAGTPVLPVESFELATLGAWLGAIDPDSADSRRQAAIAVTGRLGDEESRQLARARVAWLDGLLGFVRGDQLAIQVARREVARSGHIQAKLIDRSLAAFDRALAGDRKGAGRDLLRLEEYWAERTGGPVANFGVQRLVAAGWLREARGGEKAIRLLRWQDAMQSGWSWTTADALGAPNYLARARLEEAHGSPGLAREYYQQFLRRYDKPMPSQVHLIDEARAALARLAGQSNRTTGTSQ
jgi:tRNA A-37 threonylcarbamoyl transferase component Bud32/tetratricopeptide (TPR) repeat protein